MTHRTVRNRIKIKHRQERERGREREFYSQQDVESINIAKNRPTAEVTVIIKS